MRKWHGELFHGGVQQMLLTVLDKTRHHKMKPHEGGFAEGASWGNKHYCRCEIPVLIINQVQPLPHFISQRELATKRGPKLIWSGKGSGDRFAMQCWSGMTPRPNGLEVDLLASVEIAELLIEILNVISYFETQLSHFLTKLFQLTILKFTYTLGNEAQGLDARI